MYGQDRLVSDAVNYGAREAERSNDINHARGYLLGRSKRCFDVIVALTAIVTLSPLLVFIAVVIRLSSPGPVVFRQVRYGLGKQPFSVLKFRSMYVPPPEGAEFKQASRGDARITPIGRFIRKTSIDELPQLFNVLKGDMSIVGPRPHPVALDDKFCTEIPDYASRFRVRPGITGLAQVSGARGETPTVDHMAKRIHWDRLYVTTGSFKRDLAIVAMTLREVVASKQAF